MSYKKKGLVFSVILSFIYLFLVLAFSRESAVIIQSLMRFCVFVGFGGITTFFSIKFMHANETLQKSETRYKNLSSMIKLMCDNLPELIWAKDIEGKFLFVNKACSEILLDAKDTAEPIGKTDKYFAQRGTDAHPEIPDYFTLGNTCTDSDLAVMDQNKPLRFDESGNVKGKFLHLDVYKAPLADENGNLMGTVGSARVVTKERQMEKALRENEEKLKQIIDIVPHFVFAKDRDGHFIMANKAAASGSATTPENMVGKTHPELLGANPEQYESYLRDDREVIDSGKLKFIPEEEFTYADDGQKAIMETTKIPFTSLGIPAVLGVSVDITERKQAEKKQEKLQIQFTQAQKMESVGRLAGGVAHDFNNMLGVIIGYADIILEQLDSALPIYADLEEIRKAAVRSADLTRQLLTFSRQQTVAPRVLDLNQTMEGMLKMLHRLIGEDIDLSWLPGKDLGSVNMDPSQIDQMLANLCVNARDAIVDVGKITIETGTAALDEDYCSEHAGFMPGNFVLIAVSDDGCGMDKETQTQVFEPFFTTKELGKGTGLGLATIYGIVKQNNGFINVYSELGQGTTFKIYLPRYVGKPGRPQKEDPVILDVRGHETILLVEDEPAILRMTTRMLERLGYTVVAVDTPGEAIRLAGEYAGQIHLLMTDLVMPEMNGRDLSRNILSSSPNLKCLFISGYTANVIAHHGILEQGINFLQKPFSTKDLGVKVREIMENE